MDTWLGRLALTAPFPLTRSMHLSTSPVNDHHHIGNLKLFDVSGIQPANIRETPSVLNPVQIRSPLVLTGGGCNLQREGV